MASPPADPPPSYDELGNMPTPINPSASATSNAAPEPSRSPRRRPGPPPLLPLDMPALNQLRHKRVVLASASPRRRHLLSILGLKNVEVVPSTFKEDLPKSLSPYEYVLETATEKCRDVYTREVNDEGKDEPALVIAADTIIISSKGRILEKPRNPQDHLDMLKMLRDEGAHKVATAVVVMKPLENPVDPGYAMESHVEITSVKFDANGACRNSPQCLAALANGNSVGCDFGGLRTNPRRQRQSRRLRHTKRRIHTHREDRGRTRQRDRTTVAHYARPARKNHGAGRGPGRQHGQHVRRRVVGPLQRGAGQARASSRLHTVRVHGRLEAGVEGWAALIQCRALPRSRLAKA
ncbi:hypothetical protein PMIN03_004626 [Paraphaeosphaeria minitans]